ncbi:MAG: hypothetical protein ACREDA_12820, partial [Methylocella sp.]
MVTGPDALGALIALNRFGLGSRPGGLAAAGGDPRGFLKEEVGGADVALVTAELPPANTALQLMFADQERAREERERKAKVLPAASANGMSAPEAGMAAMANSSAPNLAKTNEPAADAKPKPAV